MVADNLEKVQMRGERIDELDERAGESNDCVSNMLWVGLIKSCAQLSSPHTPGNFYCAVCLGTSLSCCNGTVEEHMHYGVHTLHSGRGSE